MSASCFSWCPLPTHWFSRKRNSGKRHEVELQESLSPPGSSQVQVAKQGEGGTLAKSPKQSAVPTAKEYAAASGKEIVKLLESAAEFIVPVPFLQQAIGVATKIIEVCEGASAVEHKVVELQERVGHLMIVIVDHVTPKGEDEGVKSMQHAASAIEREISELHLKTINEDLVEINAQNRWVLAIYKEVNMSTVDDCIRRLSTALESFKLSNDLQDTHILQNLQSRLEKIHRLTADVATKVDVIDENVKDIHDVLLKLNSSRVLTHDEGTRQAMPLKPGVFYGRDDVVEDTSRLLTAEETSRVCILGPGGMGKTSVALAVVESPRVKERFAERSFWVPCVEAKSANLLLDILDSQLRISEDKRAAIEDIISALNSTSHPHLILLDNFETPWNAAGQKQVEDILRRLAEVRHVAILITMRGTYPPCDTISWQSKSIEPADKDACRLIFHKINPNSGDDPYVDILLEAVGYMPFAVTLMASLGKRGQSSAKELLDAWRASGTDILSVMDSPETSMNRSIELSVESDILKQQPHARLLLATLAFLPAGTTKDKLRWWAPTLTVPSIPVAVATLSDAALLLTKKQLGSNDLTLFVLPVVQSYVQLHFVSAKEIKQRMLLSCCRFVLDHACRIGDTNFPVKVKALASQDTNIQSILLDPSSTTPSNEFIEAIIAFSWYRCDTKPDLEIAGYAVRVASTSGDNQYTAMAYWCLGRTYYHLPDMKLSYDHLQKAYNLFDALPQGDAETMQKLCQCGIDLVDTATYALSLADKDILISLAHDIEARSALLGKPDILGRCLDVVGLALIHSGEVEEALGYLHRAIAILERTGHLDSLAEAYQSKTWAHVQAGRHSEALAAIRKAWQYAEHCNNLHVQTDISLDLTRTLFKNGQTAEAWRYAEIGLMAASKLGIENKMAVALDYMGLWYLHQGDYQNAYGAYEAAADNFSQRSRSCCVQRCRENMARIRRKEQQPQEHIGFIELCEHDDDDKKSPLFYPDMVAPSASGVVQNTRTSVSM